MTAANDAGPNHPDDESLLLFLNFEDTLYSTIREEGEGDSWRVVPHDGPMANEILEDILAPYLDRIEIVLSTARAYWNGVERARSMLSPRIAERVIDSIWLAELITPTWSEYNSDRATPYACIQAWLKRRRPGHAGPWLAFDSQTGGWPDTERDHLVWAGGTLWHPSTQHQLKDRLGTLLGAPRSAPRESS